LVHDALPAIIQKAAAPDSGPKNTEEILRTLSVELALFQGDLFSAAVLAEAINNIGDIKIRGEAHLAVLDACKDDQSWRGDFTARASFAGYEDTELIVKLLVKSLDTGRCAFTSFIADLKVRKPEIAQMRSPGDDLSVMDKIEEQSWLNDVSAALRYFKIPPTHVLTSDGKWNELLKSSLRKSGKIETALVLTEKRANYFLANNRIQPYPRSLRERLTSLMKPLHEVLQEENLDSTRSGLLTLAERLIVGHAIPNDEILSSMHCLGPKTREMMITIFDSCGTQYGRNVLDALSQTFPDSKELSQNQIKAVKALIETGFRGVSGETLQRFIRAYDDSPPLATLMVQLWKRAARIFTSPRSVPPDVKKDPLYAELLATAYRPGNSYFTMTTLRKYLDKAVDHDEHLKPYTFPREGWRLNLVATSESSSSQRVTEPEELVRRCFALLSDPAPINFEELGLKVLSGHFKDAPVEAVVGRLLYDYAPEELKRIQTEIAAAPDAAKRLSLLKELAEDSVAQAIDCCAEALTEKITLSKKVTKQVMTLLQFKKEREIDKGDLKKALVFGLNKVVDSLRKDITRRTKLSAQEGESLEDPILLLTKCDHSFFGRGAAALCTVEDVWSWNSDQYLQMNLLVPAEGRIYGNVQLNLFLDPENRPSIMARINISQNYKVATLAATVDAILGHFRTFARDNNLIAYVPENNCIVNLASNNGLIRDRMEAYWGKLHEVTVQVAEKEDYTVRKVHELLDEPLPPS
jgi:hypothetical protein